MVRMKALFVRERKGKSACLLMEEKFLWKEKLKAS